jgi:hypothetical protein
MTSEADGLKLTPPDEILKAAPLAPILESIHPLQHHLPDSAMVFATFAGPGLLFAQLSDAFESCGQAGDVDPDYVVDVILNVVRSSLDMKVDGIALIEQPTASTPSELLRVHKTVRKLADFYDAGFLIFNLPGAKPQESGLPAHCVFELTAGGNDMAPVAGQIGLCDVRDDAEHTGKYL